ncbi:unnamed protein product [Medioppia subpectinata]|uniref:Homeobox domain-containing protein n=1 Tax=Medioppia subpectinata TaxID=1979941 RepID=A0A7R9KFI0_9ACAR|nr:unnamed protein product [Medioppia subpectinata]CAG2102258.1 unnamed protein product [Medioppia subpectinata]
MCAMVNTNGIHRKRTVVNNTDNEFVSNYCQVMKFTVKSADPMNDTKGNTKEMYFPKSLDLERPKRSRTNFTLRQLRELEKCFAKNQYLVGKERKSLSKHLDLSEAQYLGLKSVIIKSNKYTFYQK